VGFREENYYDRDSFWYNRNGEIHDNSAEFILGVDGIIGLEYKIQTTPLSASLDWKPMINVMESFEIEAGDVAVSLRYHF